MMTTRSACQTTFAPPSPTFPPRGRKGELFSGVGCARFLPRVSHVLLAVLTALGTLVSAGCSPSTAPAPAATSSAAPKKPVTQIAVAAAADLQFAFDEVAQAFKAEHPEITVVPTYGASGNLFSQISNDAPFDMYLSADIEYPRKLIAAGLAEAGTEFKYAIGHLVVWVPLSSEIDVEQLGIEALTASSVRKIAIANPRHAPYGRAAEAAMKSLGVYDRVSDRLVLGNNVAEAALFVQTGAADAGVIALSLAVSPALRERGKYWNVPVDAYPTLEQGGVVLSRATDPEACALLKEFLAGPQGRAILERYGFVLPGK